MPPTGFLCVNKPREMTSRDAVNIAQGVARAEIGGGRGNRAPCKAGHAGTLDPLADGVLVIGIGPAVRLVTHVQQHAKTYHAKFRLGAESASGDLEEEVFERPVGPDGTPPTRPEVEAAVASLCGPIRQRPPAFSAIKVNGRRAYQDARAGRAVEIPLRSVTIHAAAVAAYEFPEIAVRITCSSGTYIRTFGTDLAARLGTRAVMIGLTRTRIGPFAIDDAIDIPTLRRGGLVDLLRQPAEGVCHLRRLICSAEQSRRLGDGLCVDGEPIDGDAEFARLAEFKHAAEESSEPPNAETSSGATTTAATTTGDRAVPADRRPGHVVMPEEIAALTETGRLRAILRSKRGQWCPHRVFPAE